jgi:hypothetical protein
MMGELAVRKDLQLALAALVAILLCLPLLLYGFPRQAHDSWRHIAWYIQVSEQVWGGELYPRWLLGMNSGLGSPAFFYYPPLPALLASPLRALVPGDPFGWHALGLAAALLLLASGVAAYAWLRELVAPGPAVVGPLLYMGHPYHYAIDLFARGALAEHAAFVWLPLILLCTRRLARGSFWAVSGLALAYAALVLSHLMTAVIVTPVILGYALISAPAGQHGAKLAAILGGLALGLGVSGLYLAPVLTLQDHVFFERLWSWSTPEQFFLFSGSVPGPYAGFLWAISVVALTTLVLCGVSFVALRRGPDTAVRREAGFWLLVALGSFLMMIFPSRPLWDLLLPLQQLQFPFRFNTVLLVALIVLVAGALGTYREVALPFKRAVALLGLLLVAGWSVPTAFYVAKQRTAYHQLSDDARLLGFLEREEYYPRTAGLVVEAYAEDRPVEPRPQVRLLAGEGDIGVEVWRPRRIELAVDMAQPGEIELGQLYYPGWHAETIAGPCCVVVQPTPGEGLIGLDLPAGSYRLVVHLESRAERVGAGISLVALALLLALPAARSLGRRPAPRGQALQATGRRR